MSGQARRGHAAIAFALAAALAGSAATVHAQEPASPWQEVATPHFVIVYGTDTEAARDLLLDQAESVYEELAAVFARQLETPITVHLYSVPEDYVRANPLAIVTDGELVQSHRGRRDIGLVIPIAESPGRGGLINALRYELGHVFAYSLSDGQLPDAIQEGIARYVERPGEAQAVSVARLRDARSAGRLRSWAEMAAPGAIYAEPAVTQAEALSMAHFFVGVWGWPRLLDALGASSASGRWTEAFESTLGASMADVEAAWLDWLPGYLDGGWRNHGLYASDLGEARRLMAAGEHEAAITQLTGAASVLAGDAPQQASEARRLLEVARTAASAYELLQVGGALLAAGDYRSAQREAESARAALADASDAVGVAAAAELADRARLGLAAASDLAGARALPPWRIAEARLLAYRAVDAYGRLGNDLAADDARALLVSLDRRQAPAGWALLGVGAVLLAWNGWRRSRDVIAEKR